MRTRRLLLVILAGVLAAGCAGGGGSAASKTTTTKPTAAPDSPQQLAADKATAQRSVLRLSDMPFGYKVSPPDKSSNDPIPPAVAKAFATCVHLPAADIEKMMNGKDDPNAPSVEADFEYGANQAVTVQNTVELDRSVVALSEPLDRFGAASAAPCWRKLVQAAFTSGAASGATFRDLTVVPLSAGSLGDQSAGFEARVLVSASGISLPAYLDFYFVRVGRAGITLFSSGIGSAVSATLQQSWIQKIVTRLGATDGSLA